MKPMNLQEEVKKLEEQESAINAVCPVEDEASWVITCKDDHEKEITQFDGEIVKKMMINDISTFLSTIDNSKISPEGFDSKVTRTVSRARMRFRTHGRAERCCASFAEWKEIGEVTKLIPEERISECIVEEITDVPVPRRRTRDSHAQEVRWKEA